MARILPGGTGRRAGGTGRRAGGPVAAPRWDDDGAPGQVVRGAVGWCGSGQEKLNGRVTVDLVRSTVVGLAPMTL